MKLITYFRANSNAVPRPTMQIIDIVVIYCELRTNFIQIKRTFANNFMGKLVQIDGQRSKQIMCDKHEFN